MPEAERAVGLMAGRTAEWRSTAFGLEIEGDFAVPGLPPATGPPTGPRTVAKLVAEETIRADWPAEGVIRLLEERFDDAPEAARYIDRAPGVGYRLYARHFGHAFVSEDGARVLCAPPDDEPWSWQRFLVGRVLPWAAVLRGREIFHASAVTLEGRAIGFIGPTGAGKSSLAIHLCLAGAGFLTDDVLAVEGDLGTLRAHPGAGIVCVRPAERAVMDADAWRRLGSWLGDSGKSYVAVERVSEPTPLAALYFLAPGEAVDEPIRLIDRPTFATLAGSTFNESILSPQRLRNQLDVCSQMATGVPLYRLAVTPGQGAAELAALVLEHERHR